MMKNKLVCEIFREIADILELQDVKFKPRAYRNAARAIETLGEDIEDYYRAGTLETIPGIGKATAKKAAEIIETGALGYLEKLKHDVPEGLLELMNVPELGPKKVMLLWKTLGIEDLAGLRSALEEHKLRQLPGFGLKSEENIHKGLELLERSKGRTLLGVALPQAEAYVAYLQHHCGAIIQRISIAGSLRRYAPTIGDMDILVSSTVPEQVMDAFVAYPACDRVLAKGPTKSSVLLKRGLQSDLRVVDDRSFGAAQQYFTGSKAHNIKLRSIALKRDLKLNEYGVFPRDGDEAIASRTEEDVYEALGLPVIAPELREDRGEVEAALEQRLPKLINFGELRGDLHVHTPESDGKSPLAELIAEAQRLGYEYLGIADHSKRMTLVHGLDHDRIVRQHETLAALNEELRSIDPPFRLFHGTEVDILEDGSLDHEDETLAILDYAIASVHSKFKQPKREMTERLIRAIEHPLVTALGHPTAKLYGQREPCEVDLDAVFEVAAKTQTWIEINAFPDRFDLEDIYMPRAKEYGVKFVISTDSHNTEHLKFAQLGLAQARRGWLETDDIINTLSATDLAQLLNIRK